MPAHAGQHPLRHRLVPRSLQLRRPGFALLARLAGSRFRHHLPAGQRRAAGRRPLFLAGAPLNRKIPKPPRPQPLGPLRPLPTHRRPSETPPQRGSNPRQRRPHRILGRPGGNGRPRHTDARGSPLRQRHRPRQPERRRAIHPRRHLPNLHRHLYGRLVLQQPLPPFSAPPAASPS